MIDRTVLAISALLLLAAPAQATDCPAEGSGWEGREDAVRKAPTCNVALKVAEACAYGASGDTGLTNIVLEKCEAGFSVRMSKVERRVYDRGMYRSMAAFCRATFARDTSAKFAKVPRK